MASLNKVQIIGNLGRDPETRFTPAGAGICNFSVATSRKWRNKDSGETQEETEWHRCVAFGRTAELAQEYLTKGSAVYIEGRLKTRSWEKDDVKHYSTEIVVESLQFIGGKHADEAPASQPQRPAAAPRPKSNTDTGFDEMADDIPF